MTAAFLDGNFLLFEIVAAAFLEALGGLMAAFFAFEEVTLTVSAFETFDFAFCLGCGLESATSFFLVGTIAFLILFFFNATDVLAMFKFYLLRKIKY